MHIRRHGEESPFVRTAPGRFSLRELLVDGRKPYEAVPLQPSRTVERVLVFPTRLIDKLGRFQGIRRHCAAIYAQLLRSNECKYLPRLEAESVDDHKQVVTYTLVKNGKKLLAFKRGNYTRADRFLRGFRCVGFGGHVTESDLTFFNQSDLGVRDSAVRELLEEIHLPDVDKKRLFSGEGPKLIGALNDDSSAVGRRHFAFVFEYELATSSEDSTLRKGEKAVIDLRWIDPSS